MSAVKNIQNSPATHSDNAVAEVVPHPRRDLALELTPIPHPLERNDDLLVDIVCVLQHASLGAVHSFARLESSTSAAEREGGGRYYYVVRFAWRAAYSCTAYGGGVANAERRSQLARARTSTR